MGASLLHLLLSVLIGFVQCSTDTHHLNRSGHHDYCVLGAGPAGLQMGHYLSKSQRDYIVFERNSGPGSFFNIYPRHRKLISINKVYTGRRNREFNLRHDWNSLLSDRPDLLFQRVSQDLYPEADAYPRYLHLFVKELGLRVHYGVDIGKVRASQSSTGRHYILTDQLGAEYTCRVLLVSTGLWDPQKVDFVGSELVEGYESISVDPEDYKNQAILILGKGNSAFETAQSILGRASRIHLYSPSPVRLAWQTHYVGDLRAVNNELLDTYQLKSLDGLVEGGLEDIAVVRQREEDQREGRLGKRSRRRAGGTEKTGQLYLTLAELLEDHQGRNVSRLTAANLPVYHSDNFSLRQPYDRVIRCLGFRFNFSIFDGSARPPSSEGARGRLPGVTAWYEGRGTPGLFVLGTAAHSRDYRSSAGGFIHGFRYTVRSVHRVLEHRYHGSPWPSTKLLTTQLLSWILKRVNEASGPYQMFGVLGDVILLHGAQCEYLEEFPIQALPQFCSLSGHGIPKHGLLVLVMQYGLNRTDSLGPGRAESEWTRAWKSNFLHPVLYYYDTFPTEDCPFCNHTVVFASLLGQQFEVLEELLRPLGIPRIPRIYSERLNKDMRRRPSGWLLPRPRAVHHIIEDFLTEWDGPISHTQPLRRFLEHCLQMDLRAFYAESCFQLSLTHRRSPLFCRQRYLNKQGVFGNSQLWQHTHDAALMLSEQDSDSADTSFPKYLTRAGASVTSGLKLDF